ncbi:MAG TPA: serine hydrolase domain-containing protein, partial [Chloroflexota bacterium]|nr:serine hydrolase domain-containing protein [Chloroflexota bacterium]
LGMQVAAYVDGELVVDAWAGIADEASGRAVDERTMFGVSSASKGLAATCTHLLAERGKLDYDERVATYWPEFAANGKERTTVRHILSHRSGIGNAPEGFGPEMAVDWARTCAAIAAMQPLFEPGTKTAYQNFTFGYLTGELIRRIDGRTIGQFLQDEVCRPLEIDSMFFGVPSSELGRVATIKAPERPRQPNSLSSLDFNRTDIRQSAIPSTGGIMTARSLARHYDALLRGELLPLSRIALATEIHTDEIDSVWNVRIKRGLGYRLNGDTGPGAGPRAFGHVGAGIYGYADPDRRLAIAFVRNYMGPSAGPPAGDTVADAILQALSS